VGSLLTALAAIALVVAHPVPALAVGDVEAVAEALRRDEVYVDPTAERALSDGEAAALRRRIEQSGQAVFVAILPASFAPDEREAQGLPERVGSAVGVSGTYAVVVGDRFRVASSSVPEADEIATAAIQAQRDEGTLPVLNEFVDRLGDDAVDARPGSSGARSPAAEREPDGDDGGTGLLPLVVLGAGGVGLFAWLRNRGRRRQRQADETALAADRQMLRAELSVVADDVLRLEPHVATRPEAREDYEAGVGRYRAAEAALDYADEPIDLVRVERVIAEARYAMSRADAVVRGHEPLPLPEELRRPGRHDEPPLDVDEGGRPYYVGYGGPFYGGGWFGGGGGILSGLLLGSVLGGMGGWGWGGNHIDVHNYGDGGGDAGAGDWGDVGGGDWGGDVGGGDW
jgi:hypothetical protein